MSPGKNESSKREGFKLDDESMTSPGVKRGDTAQRQRDDKVRIVERKQTLEELGFRPKQKDFQTKFKRGKQFVSKVWNLTSPSQLKSDSRSIWKNLEVKLLEKLAMSMNNRIPKVVAAQGGKINY